MIKTTTNQTNVLTSLAGIHQVFEKNSDGENLEKVKQLIKKAVDQEVQLAFCGHFSAGKSSMINHLLGRNVLPSSPIPTSANIVKLKQGNEGVKVCFFDDKHAIFEGTHDMNDIKRYCKEGEDIREIHIYSEDFPLPADCAVLDTPGIDSTDDAHRISTESTLHLADIILYVMDYNHVQSQENFLFAKKMTEAGKKLYLIVNQIDKHDDSELNFMEFRNSVANAFSQWNINPERIFYTSLRNLEFPGNQIEEVQKFIHDRLQFERNHLNDSIIISAKQLVQDHLSITKLKKQEEIAAAKDLLSTLTDEERNELPITFNELAIKKQKIQTYSVDFHTEKLNQLNELLKNVYLLSAESRDLIKSFLEGQQSSFKVGMFFSKSKTDAERIAREERLYTELQQRTKTQLEWHLRELAAKSLIEADVDSPELNTKAQQLKIDFQLSEIKKLVMKQSEITGNYVLHFSETVANLIKHKAKKEMIHFYEGMQLIIENEQERRLLAINQEIDKLSQYDQALSFLENVQVEEERIFNECKAIIDEKEKVEISLMESILLDMKEREKQNEIAFEVDKTVNEQAIPSTISIQSEDSNYSNNDLGSKEDLRKWSDNLQKAANELKGVKGFSTIGNEFMEKANRMKNQTYTVALFGAFSAGKSSFANALFGEKVLPVSPNPTTAVINKVMASTDNNLHKTASIKLKSTEMMLDDVKLACKALDYSPATLEDAYGFAEKVDEIVTDGDGDGRENAQLSFIKAFYKGFSSQIDKLGQEFVVEYEEYTKYAADESKSCFVDEITLYFDCELTNKGIILVDTPGADSINARHTNAAFHYIKNSDAILFVTYYNHPFAKSDREFLIQLGRVKDAFSMDKMFFICNAIDLAQNEEELFEVSQYIKGQLESFGIRLPRLFPLSSKEALQEQQDDYKFQHPFIKNSGMDAFRSAFSYFIQNELIDLACTSAKSSLKRAMTQLHEVITAANATAEEKQARLGILENDYLLLKELIAQTEYTIEKQKLLKEIEELLYYINQRVFLRYNDFFKESFNPSVLRDDGRDLKAVLRKALRELLDSIGFDLEQELRATSVRVERYMNVLIKDKYAYFNKTIAKTWPSVEIGEFTAGKYEVPEFNQALKQLTDGTFKRELSLFKNPKSFFEKNEKKKMAEAIQKTLQEPTQQYLNEEGNIITSYYGKSLQNELILLQKHIEKNIDEVYKSYAAVLKEQIDVEFYRKKESVLKQLLGNE